nr:ATP-binding cassette domain-containing protein [Shimia sp. CNT1-13L.2]
MKDINLDIPRAGATAIIGPNGAGKSTLLNLVARLQPLQTGSISIDGQDVGKTPTAQIAKALAIVSQQNFVASRLRVRDLVGFGRWPHHRGRMGPEDHEAVDQALAAFDLLSFQSRFLDELSGGQQQRAFVAMGFAQGTDWLLLDEPLNNLDMFHARALMKRVHGVSRSGAAGGRQVLMVVHEINYVAAWADHVVALREGEVALQGAPEEILTSAALSGLYEMDIQVSEHQGRPLVLHHV